MSDPFSARAEAAMDHAFAAMVQAALLTGDAVVRRFAEFKKRQQIALRLSRPVQKWWIGEMRRWGAPRRCGNPISPAG